MSQVSHVSTSARFFGGRLPVLALIDGGSSLLNAAWLVHRARLHRAVSREARRSFSHREDTICSSVAQQQKLFHRQEFPVYNIDNKSLKFNNDPQSIPPKAHDKSKFANELQIFVDMPPAIQILLGFDIGLIQSCICDSCRN